jgi:hypothetical protein
VRESKGRIGADRRGCWRLAGVAAEEFFDGKFAGGVEGSEARFVAEVEL